VWFNESKVISVLHTLKEYQLILIGFACLVQTLIEPENVLAYDFSFFILHGVTPNMRSAQRQRGHHP
jgi:hypothetical protein